MIHVARFDGTDLIINADLIETIEETPDTVVTLVNGKKFVVREAARELVQRIVAYRRGIRGSRERTAAASLSQALGGAS